MSHIFDVNKDTNGCFTETFYILAEMVKGEIYPVVARLIDPEDKKEKECIFLFADKSVQEKLCGGEFKDTTKYQALLINNTKAGLVVPFANRYNLVALMCFEADGEVHMQPLKRMMTVAKA